MHNKVSRRFILQLVALGVLGNGVILVSTALGEALEAHAGQRLNSLLTSLPLLTGLTLIYLATLLNRRKRAAWMVVLPIYGFVGALNLTRLLMGIRHDHFVLLAFVRGIIVPAVVVYGLIRYRHEFNVKSDIQNITVALRTSILVLVVALAYGVSGFMLLDKRDFHQEIGTGEAIHRTIDQFDFTTDHQLVAYTRRARLFLDTLNILSTGALVYVLLSLFQPLRTRLSDQTLNREDTEKLLRHYPASSEDFFKLWPQDKNYFFGPHRRTALAYHVYHGVALVVGDPAGKHAEFPLLMDEFLAFCRVNDWQPALIHTEPEFNQLYENYDFSLQKIGEEAIVDIENFQNSVVAGKYFRQIKNKFEKQTYTAELLTPPHNPAIIQRIKTVSDEWLGLPGRSERGFMMGYFSETYLQQCPIMILRDAAGTIQAFINQIPSFDSKEANYDLLRHSKTALTNSNDFLLLNFIDYLQKQGFERLNLGLCPLAGLDNHDQDRTLVDNALGFVYSNGDRFYSFSGLRRFKAKYEPNWSSRYIAYKNGLRGFTRTLNALNKTMSHLKK